MKIRKIAVMAASVMLLTGMTGCELGGDSTETVRRLNETEVFRIGDTVCTLPKAKVYLCNYQNIYGEAYGIQLWDNEKTRASLEDYVKDITMSELTHIVCMEELAAQREVVLTEEEKDTAAEAAKAYYASLNEQELAYMEADEALLQEMYEDYALAQKLYETVTESVDKEVSDDEARVMDAAIITVQDKDKADAVAKALKSEQDFLTVAGEYNESDKTELSFGRGDLPAEVEEKAFEMDEEEITPCIQTADGYYYLKCLCKLDREQTDAKKAEIVKQREQEVFDRVYQAYVDAADSELNKTLWQSVRVDADAQIATDGFFAVYEEYFNAD